ncbi:headcase protein [Drosophila subobscura]|uniref:headcase protein n=1 Tax=Drosophila subobscura TaxID=7241 RepID=UPI00155AB878|nr:headcase protein [Drosophila subobscura]
MSTRQMISWRIYVYANSLYSVQPSDKRGFREWSPQALRDDPCAIHRIMDWVNRDASVLVRSSEEEMVIAYEVVHDMLAFVPMRSTEFQDALLTFFGGKTSHFVHELINFARSPYDDPIAYELSVQYRSMRPELVEMPCTSAEALKRQQAKAELHNFVQFAARMDNDDCLSFEADMELEAEDSCAIDELVLVSQARIVGRAQMAESQQPQQQQQQQEPPTLQQQPPTLQQQPPTSQQPPVQPSPSQEPPTRQNNSYADAALQEAIARSMLETAQNHRRDRAPRRFWFHPSARTSAHSAWPAQLATRGTLNHGPATARRGRRNGAMDLVYAFHTYGMAPP